MSDGTKQFPCKQCGAMLTFEPGTRALKCHHCGTLNEIAASGEVIEELDYAGQLLRLEQGQETHEETTVHCEGCGADSTLPPNQSAGRCPFCGRAIVASGTVRTLIKPKSLLPFAINRDMAKQKFGTWLAGLWFAPSGLQKFADAGGLVGVYLPAWTFDCNTVTDYTGGRGEHYWVSESYTAFENGKSVRRTRQVRKTRWYSAAGVVHDVFDDVLVLAERSLPDDLRNKLSGWDLPALVPYADEYLSGFVAETYQIELPAGFEIAKQMMEPVIATTIRRDIGGDEQRIDSMDVVHNDIRFKHILLPVWISAYRFHDRTFRFVINARTGQVFGQRPWSAWKIAALVALILVVVLIVFLLANMNR